MRRSTGQGLSSDTVMRPAGPGCREGRIYRSEGVKDHQGLVVDHQYQARPCLACPGRSRLTAWDRGAAAPGKTGEPTASPRRRSFGARKAPPAKRSTVPCPGASGKNTPPPLPLPRRGGGCLRPNDQSPRATSSAVRRRLRFDPPGGVDASTGPTYIVRCRSPGLTVVISV